MNYKVGDIDRKRTVREIDGVFVTVVVIELVLAAFVALTYLTLHH